MPGAAKCAAPAPPAQTQVQRLIQGFEAVESLSCELRRDKPLPDGSTFRMLSRVLWQRPNQLNAENVTPSPRRTVCDGTVFRQYVKGADKGFSRPVADLPPPMLPGLTNIPGANLDVLAPLANLPEEELSPEADGLRRYAYAAPSGTYTLLLLDAEDRWVGLKVYASAAMTDLSASSTYADFIELAPGAWLACRQESTVRIGGQTATETLRLSRVEANAPIPASAFDPQAFFPAIDFVDSFDKIKMP